MIEKKLDERFNSIIEKLRNIEKILTNIETEVKGIDSLKNDIRWIKRIGWLLICLIVFVILGLISLIVL